MANISFSAGIFALFIFKIVSGAALDDFLSESSSCKAHCYETFSESPDAKSCSEGCRLFKMIGLSKGFNNKTVDLCFGACKEALTNVTTAGVCNYGCHHGDEAKPKDEQQSIHLLTPLLYVKSAYNTMAHHVRQLVSASMTVYIQEDSGNMVVLQTKPKIEKIEEVRGRQTEEDRLRYMRNFKPPWETDKIDWMDCISHQSGLPKFILVLALFGFIVVLIWLCCATAVTAPHHYLGTPKEQKRNINYVLLCEPNPGEVKSPSSIINCDEEAPPLPPKVSLI